MDRLDSQLQVNTVNKRKTTNIYKYYIYLSCLIQSIDSYNKQASLYAELREKYIHLNQLYETEAKSKWQYLAQIEELSNEVKTLREEVSEHVVI